MPAGGLLEVDQARPRNAPLWPALDSGVRLANELHAAPALLSNQAKGRGLDLILIPHAQAPFPFR
jgi:hypothetical protein